MQAGVLDFYHLNCKKSSNWDSGLFPGRSRSVSRDLWSGSMLPPSGKGQKPLFQSPHPGMLVEFPQFL